MKNSNDTIWNQTRDLPAFSAVHQPTGPPRAPNPPPPVKLYVRIKILVRHSTPIIPSLISSIISTDVSIQKLLHSAVESAESAIEKMCQVKLSVYQSVVSR